MGGGLWGGLWGVSGGNGGGGSGPLSAYGAQEGVGVPIWGLIAMGSAPLLCFCMGYGGGYGGGLWGVSGGNGGGAAAP